MEYYLIDCRSFFVEHIFDIITLIVAGFIFVYERRRLTESRKKILYEQFSLFAENIHKYYENKTRYKSASNYNSNSETIENGISKYRELIKKNSETKSFREVNKAYKEMTRILVAFNLAITSIEIELITEY